MRYTQTHEWICLDPEHERVGIVGITDYAQRELGEVVFVQLPQIGQKVESGEEVAVLESTKAASDIYTPVAGEVVEVNTALLEEPSLLNSSPQKQGWIFKIALSDPNALETLLQEPVNA